MAKSDPTHIRWRKSTASEPNDCVEVAFVEHAVLVRHSRDPSGPKLTYSEAEWAAFLAGVRNGEFDLDPPSPS